VRKIGRFAVLMHLLLIGFSLLQQRNP
jgi:hypothetical protein